MLEACETRKDTQSELIRVRLGGVLTDLPAADARHHVAVLVNTLPMNKNIFEVACQLLKLKMKIISILLACPHNLFC